MSLLNTTQLEYALQILACFSLLTFGISIVCIPLLVARLPRNFFQLTAKSNRSNVRKFTLRNAILSLLRNITGFALLLAGIAMLFLPGQGIITIIIALATMSFPLKNELIYKLTRKHSVQQALDWMRKKMKKETFYW